MAAAATDKFKKLARRWVGQIGSGGVADGVTTTIPLSSVTNLPTDTGVVVVIDRVDANGTATPNLEETVYGVVSGSNLISCVRGVEGTAQGHSGGAVVEVLFDAKAWADVVDGIVLEHNQDGTHKTSAVVTPAGTQTLTNKRRTRRVVTVTQSATPTVNTDNTDVASITALAQAITSMTTNLTGTPVAGDLVEFQITDDGTARAITWGASFEGTTANPLPTTTVISTMLRVLLEWNTVASKWDCVAVS